MTAARLLLAASALIPTGATAPLTVPIRREDHRSKAMIPFLLLVSTLCLSTGCYIVYRMSSRDHATTTDTPAQEEAAFLATERTRFNKLVAGLDPQARRLRQDQRNMTDRHSINTITIDTLDALYAERDRLREQLDKAHHRYGSHNGRQDAHTAPRQATNLTSTWTPRT
ncbi:hypothetical protein [Streptomyces cupreus]|uniref:Uncharacterized protein n=1 Tax=Streptomyces cupreus TaxID=2759956 RepID=A0A7X1JCC3_9ACTN|nr:hypothetical protein [Streptomyces cupreus]MBC2908159.1 hypothetical protein [Streptomyces cupreus]